MAPDLGPLCSIGGYSFCEAAHVAERHRRACRDFVVPPLLPGWLGRVDCLLSAVGGWIFLATASLSSTAVASSKCSLAQRSSTHTASRVRPGQICTCRPDAVRCA